MGPCKQLDATSTVNAAGDSWTPANEVVPRSRLLGVGNMWTNGPSAGFTASVTGANPNNATANAQVITNLFIVSSPQRKTFLRQQSFLLQTACSYISCQSVVFGKIRF
jgi:hypothetical protein